MMHSQVESQVERLYSGRVTSKSRQELMVVGCGS